MRILLDFTQIPLARTGVGVYADHLLDNLLDQMAADDRLHVLLQDDETVLPRRLPADGRLTYHRISSRLFRKRAALLLFEQFAIPVLARRWRADIVHSLHYTFPLVCPAARVVTIHDLTFFLWPGLHTRGRRLLFRPFIRMALRHAEAVIFVSQATARDAEALVLQPARQHRQVAPLGVDVSPSATSSRSRDALARFHLAGPYLLFLGTIEPRKNVPRLIRAFDAVAQDRPDLTLVLAGKLGWDAAEFQQTLQNSPVNKRILCTGFVTDEERQALLQSAAMLAYPSLYEGFGLPVLEAMAAGTPVLTSNISSLPEVAGEAACLIDPYSVEAIAQAVRTILDGTDLADELRRRGRQQAMTFTWQRTARETYSAYLATARRGNVRSNS